MQYEHKQSQVYRKLKYRTFVAAPAKTLFQAIPARAILVGSDYKMQVS